ncbi:hypothetical protein F66182_5493 [Fusarium sp. NRRL 66182]|nr:hypothetical protein F66182_5493 [Fusarium sp. NRRL 66182]
MRSASFLSCAVAVVLGARQVLGITHGQVSEFAGKKVRWQELAEGVFTGVPEDKWDDRLHKRANIELDIDEMLANGTTPLSSDATELGVRDLEAQCQAAQKCVIKGTQYVLLLAYSAWLGAANFVANGNLMEYLNQPFYANAAGVAIAGIISGQINEVTKKECSSEPPQSSQADIIRAAIEAVLDKNPEAEEISVDVQGPSGTVNIKVRAGAPGSNPVPSCQ